MVLVFFALLVVVAVVEMIDTRKGDRTFRDVLVDVPPGEVSMIQVIPRALGGETVTLVKENEKWMIESEVQKFNANQSLPGSMISELNNLKPESVVATQKSQWGQYEVTDSLGTRVKLFGGGELLSDLIIGKFNFNQQTRKLTSYVRLAEDKEVYGVDGFLSMTFNRDVASLRDQTVINSVRSNWTKLTFSYPADSSFVLAKTGDTWYIGGVPADSADVAGYFSGISNLNDNNFYNEKPTGQPTHALVIEGNNMDMPVRITGYSQQSGNYIIGSNLNEGTFFNSKELAEEIFISRNQLISE